MFNVFLKLNDNFNKFVASEPPPKKKAKLPTGPWSKQKTVEVKVETKEEDDPDLNEKLAQALRNHVPLHKFYHNFPLHFGVWFL